MNTRSGCGGDFCPLNQRTVKPGIDASIQDIQPSKQNIEREYRTLEKLLDFAVRLNYNDADKNEPYG